MTVKELINEELINEDRIDTKQVEEYTVYTAVKFLKDFNIKTNGKLNGSVAISKGDKYFCFGDVYEFLDKKEINSSNAKSFLKKSNSIKEINKEKIESMLEKKANAALSNKDINAGKQEIINEIIKKYNVYVKEEDIKKIEKNKETSYYSVEFNYKNKLIKFEGRIAKDNTNKSCLLYKIMNRDENKDKRKVEEKQNKRFKKIIKDNNNPNNIQEAMLLFLHPGFLRIKQETINIFKRYKNYTKVDVENMSSGVDLLLITPTENKLFMELKNTDGAYYKSTDEKYFKNVLTLLSNVKNNKSDKFSIGVLMGSGYKETIKRDMIRDNQKITVKTSKKEYAFENIDNKKLFSGSGITYAVSTQEEFEESLLLPMLKVCQIKVQELLENKENITNYLINLFNPEIHESLNINNKELIKKYIITYTSLLTISSLKWSKYSYQANNLCNLLLNKIGKIQLYNKNNTELYQNAASVETNYFNY